MLSLVLAVCSSMNSIALSLRFFTATLLCLSLQSIEMEFKFSWASKWSPSNKNSNGKPWPSKSMQTGVDHEAAGAEDHGIEVAEPGFKLIKPYQVVPGQKCKQNILRLQNDLLKPGHGIIKETELISKGLTVERPTLNMGCCVNFRLRSPSLCEC